MLTNVLGCITHWCAQELGLGIGWSWPDCSIYQHTQKLRLGAGGLGSNICQPYLGLRMCQLGLSYSIYRCMQELGTEVGSARLGHSTHGYTRKLEVDLAGLGHSIH